jgi:radical SAM superfamily enzyme YgiQ (UPF0313 family)
LKVLLIYPKYPDTFWSFKHILKFISRKAAFPPLGLLTVAAMLPADWEKRLIDINVKPLQENDLEWADTVFISAMIVQEESAREAIALCKTKGKTVVAGGPLFNTQWKSFNNVDHFVLNEAEITLPRFLKDLKKGNCKRIYTSSKRPAISATPIPMWSLIRFKDYATMALQYSRGCPFNCEFCDIVIMNGRIPRTKSPEQLIKEIQSLYDAGWKGSLFIVDDNFIGNKNEVKRMLPFIIQWQRKHKYPFKILTEASANLADDEELLKMMSKANFCKVFLGIETPQVESLIECHKMQNTRRDLSESVRIIQKNGMQVMGGFIVGFDNDQESTFDLQIKFIQKVGIVTAMVGLLAALPKTRLWNRLKTEGRLLAKTTGENTDGSLNFVPKMEAKQLQAGYRKILNTIYSPKQYYKRINTFLKNYKPKSKSRFSKIYLYAFLRSTWRIGIFSRSWFRYWKLIIRTMFTKIRALPEAIELAIYGVHFQKITRKISKP